VLSHPGCAGPLPGPTNPGISPYAAARKHLFTGTRPVVAWMGYVLWKIRLTSTTVRPVDMARHRRPLSESVSFVTGASRGIGAAIARELAAAGSHVVIDYHTDAAGAQRVVEEIRAANCDAEAVLCDVADHAAVAAAIADVAERHGRLDVLVNNAGILRDRSFLKLSPREWHDVIDVNLHGVMNTCSAVLPLMVERKAGCIVNISSFVAQTGNFGQTNYAAAKAGIIGLTRSLALEVAAKGIRVNAICPGFIETGMWQSIPDEVREKILDRIPMRRVGTPEDVARTVRFLVTEGDYITGQTINVNGGIFIG
jgi:acetoacetyl-CoA reductase